MEPETYKVQQNSINNLNNESIFNVIAADSELAKDIIEPESLIFLAN